jgi:aspartyl-tRNA synthetase
VIRTRDAGTLRSQDAKTDVVLAGWVARRRDHGGVAFVDIRDASGTVQVVIRDTDVADQLRAEYCVKVVGEVALRPAGNENPDIATGQIEVLSTEIQVLSTSDPLPFSIDEHLSVGEDSRLRYRYLDLRRDAPGRALRLRAAATKVMREVMDSNGFLEIETPYLTRSTPEGARDFLVPVRLQPGHWYALPQSPQLFKQLLMVAGMERYYQIVRCFRDEDFRADRQPEFTQLDIEMSFVDQDDVIQLAEQVVAALWKQIHDHAVSLPLPRMTYAEAMARFGSDKPDVRFGHELVDLTSHFSDTEFRVFQAEHVGAVVMPGGASQSRKELDAWQEWARARGALGPGQSQRSYGRRRSLLCCGSAA